MIKRILIGALLALSLTACPPPGGGTTTPTQERPPPVSVEALAAKPVPYARTVTPTWPRETTRRQLVISGGWQPGESFAWLIADGTKVVAVYRVTREDMSDLLVKIGQQMVFTSVGTDNKSDWVIAGAVKVPDPPPPPEPGGFPGDYVERVMAAAWRATQVSQPLTTATGKTFGAP